MREIKFRAWYEANWINEKLGKYGELEEQWRMGKVHSLHFNKNKAMVSSSSGVISLEIGDKCKVMQYTGLKDKKGKEIYEGDILQGDHYPVSKNDGYVLIVEYGTDRFWGVRTTKAGSEVRGISDGIADGLLEFEGEGLEVIGNIYENPSLLEVQNDR